MRLPIEAGLPDPFVMSGDPEPFTVTPDSMSPYPNVITLTMPVFVPFVVAVTGPVIPVIGLGFEAWEAACEGQRCDQRDCFHRI